MPTFKKLALAISVVAALLLALPILYKANAPTVKVPPHSGLKDESVVSSAWARENGEAIYDQQLSERMPRSAPTQTVAIQNADIDSRLILLAKSQASIQAHSTTPSVDDPQLIVPFDWKPILVAQLDRMWSTPHAVDGRSVYGCTLLRLGRVELECNPPSPSDTNIGADLVLAGTGGQHTVQGKSDKIIELEKALINALRGENSVTDQQLSESINTIFASDPDAITSIEAARPLYTDVQDRLDGGRSFSGVATGIDLLLSYEQPDSIEVVPKGPSPVFHAGAGDSIEFNPAFFKLSPFSARFMVQPGETVYFTTRLTAGARIIGQVELPESFESAHALLTRVKYVEPEGSHGKLLTTGAVYAKKRVGRGAKQIVFDDVPPGNYVFELFINQKVNEFVSVSREVLVTDDREYVRYLDPGASCSLRVYADIAPTSEYSGRSFLPDHQLRVNVRRLREGNSIPFTMVLLWDPSAGPLTLGGLLPGRYLVATQSNRFRLEGEPASAIPFQGPLQEVVSISAHGECKFLLGR